MKLDDMTCEECGKKSCSSWSATEGARCNDHSSYVGPRADEASRLGNIRAAQRYVEELKVGCQSQDIRDWMLAFIKRWLRA